jgi:hypothetical protein
MVAAAVNPIAVNNYLGGKWHVVYVIINTVRRVKKNRNK